MFKLDIIALVIEFIITKCIIEFNYNLIIDKLPNIFTLFLSQLFFCIYLTAHSLYLVLAYNIILTSSHEGYKSILIAIMAQLAPVWELLKLVYGPEDLSKVYTIIVYIVTASLLSILNITCLNTFDKLKKFNFGFSLQYLILALLNIQVNPIIPCIIFGIVSTYLTPLTLDKSTIKPRNIISVIFMFQEFILIVFIHFILNDEVTILSVSLSVKAATAVVYVVAVIFDFRMLNISAYDAYNNVGSGNDIEEGRINNSQADSTGSNNYSTFTN